MFDSQKKLTPQEQWIIGGEAVSEGRERALQINRLIRSRPHKMDISRAKLFIESFKTTEGENLSLRWAKALFHVAGHIPVYIEPDYELLVGKVCGSMGQFSLLYPELDGPNLLQLRECEKRPTSPFEMDPEDLIFVEEELYPYWKDRSYAQAYAQALPDETRKFTFGDDKRNFSNQKYIISQSTTARSSLNFNYDLETILRIGIQGFQDEAEKRLRNVKDNPKDYVKEGAFWEAAILSCQACTIFMQRYAQEVRRVANSLTNLGRRQELLEIADNCDWVAVHPARDFRSALQLQWFIMVIVRLEQNVGAALGSARMDQHLLPYYRQDVAAGKITPEQAKEWFECYWLNLSQITQVATAESSAKLFEGYAHFETVTIDGQTRDGKDATNELSYLILESKRGFPIPYPDLAARIHARTPEKIRRMVAKALEKLSDESARAGYSQVLKQIAAASREEDRDLVFYDAPAVIIVIDNFGDINGALAASRMELQVNALGLGACFIGFFAMAAANDIDLRDVIGLPEGYHVVTSLAIGHPDVVYRRTVVRREPLVIWQ